MVAAQVAPLHLAKETMAARLLALTPQQTVRAAAAQVQLAQMAQLLVALHLLRAGMAAQARLQVSLGHL
jgi:hypothetical protein